MAPPKLPKAYSAAGSSMGRGSDWPERDAEPRRVKVWKIRINSQGYDDGGAYWGIGSPLYCCEFEDDEFVRTQYVRARHRDAAKEIVRQTIPNARFYR